MFEKSTDQLAADVERWAVKEESLMRQQRDAAAKIAALEVSAGDALLDSEGDGQPSTAPIDAVVRARSEAAAVTAAIASCRLRRIQAITAKRAALAAELRREVMALRRQLDVLDRKTSECMQTLGELQGVAFSAMPTPTEVGVPLSQLLANRIQAAESQAARLEGKLPSHGTIDIDGTDISGLLEAVLRVEAESPDTQSIIDWAVRCERASKRDFGALQRRFHLAWSNAEIDVRESYVQVSALVKTTEGSLGGVVRELGTDMFKSAAVA
jgi:hypothetical protein